MFFAISACIPVLLIVSLSLCFTIIFYKSIVSFMITPGTSIYTIIKNSNPSLVDVKVDINFHKVCLAANSSSNCYRELKIPVLKDYNITLYGSSNISTNYLNLPEVAQDFSHVYLGHMRDFMYVVTSLVAVLLLMQVLSKAFLNIKLLTKVVKLVMPKMLELNAASKVSSWINNAEVCLVAFIIVFYLLISVNLVINLKSIKMMAEETSLNILSAKVNDKFIAVIWANLSILVTVLLGKVVYWQVMNIKKTTMNVDIIQPKV